MSIRFQSWFIRAFLTIMLLTVNLTAQEEIAGEGLDKSAAADTSSPRATLKSFIYASNQVYEIVKTEEHLNRNNLEHMAAARRMLDCIDTRDLPEFARDERAAEVAVCIKEILDRNNLPQWEDIPDLAEIEAKGGYEKLSRYRIPGTRITIGLIEEGPQKYEYLFTAGTVDRAVEYYDSERIHPYRTTGPATSPGLYKWYMSAPGHPWVGSIVHRFPERMRFGRTLGMANWKWPGLILAIIVALFAMIALYRLQFSLAARAHQKHIVLYVLTIIFPFLAIMVPLYFEHFARRILTVRGNALYIVQFSCFAVATLATVIFTFVAVNRFAEAIIASPKINARGLNAQLIRISARLVSVVLAVIVFLVGGQFLGIPVATLLASAGIGGVALALGAQDTLKTLFGTLMLMADKPFRVGERIVFRGYDGVVEDIGLRSTRLRLLSSHQVTIPNDELARTDIENIGRRQSIRRVIDIHIPLDTSREKVKAAVEIVRKALENHEGMEENHPPRVYFFDFLPDAFAIRVIYWYHPPEYWKYMEFSEKLNFEIFKAFEEQGIQFSLPSRITRTQADGTPLSAEAEQGPTA